MARRRRIRQVLEPKIAKQEVKNISKMYEAMGWVVNVSTDVENGSIIHRIEASKGKHSLVIVELEEAKPVEKETKERVVEERPIHAPPEPVTSQELDSPSEAKTEPPLQPRPVVESKKAEKPPLLKSSQKEDLQTYVEQDETGIVPALVAEGALVLEDGAVKVRKWIARDKYLHAREFFKRIGITL